MPSIPDPEKFCGVLTHYEIKLTVRKTESVHSCNVLRKTAPRGVGTEQHALYTVVPHGLQHECRIGLTENVGQIVVHGSMGEQSVHVVVVSAAAHMGKDYTRVFRLVRAVDHIKHMSTSFGSAMCEIGESGVKSRMKGDEKSDLYGIFYNSHVTGIINEAILVIGM